MPGSFQRTFPRFDINVEDEEGVEVSGLRHVDKKSPAWYLAKEILDQYNHLMIISKRGRFIGITFTSPIARTAIARRMRSTPPVALAHLSPLTSPEMKLAFVESKVRTLWLNGAHRRTEIKPDSKIITGVELESALDPLEDQSYYFSSIRSTSKNKALSSNGTRNAVVGVSPTKSQVWIGPTATWQEFLGRMGEIFQHAEKRLRMDAGLGSGLSVLARPAFGLNGVAGAYGVALIVPEDVATGIAQVDGEPRWLEQFGDAVQFENISSIDNGPDFSAEVYWNDQRLGTLQYRFEVTGDSVKLKVDGKFEGEDKYLAVLERACRDRDNLTIYFESGHTYGRGQMFEANVRDAQFSNWRWVRMPSDNTAIKQEKPNDNHKFVVDNIGREGDMSLFGFVARHWPNLENRGNQTGWLVCDDGSMESADFIHFDDTGDVSKLTLIHVKGSGSDRPNRGISVSDYEVVVGQAVKNLRHIDRGLLCQKLNANREGALRNAVWYNGDQQDNRDDIISLLQDVGSNYETNVVVLQPRTRKLEYERVRNLAHDGLNYATLRLKQLDALLLGARASCYGLGASFEVIGERDE